VGAQHRVKPGRSLAGTLPAGGGALDAFAEWARMPTWIAEGDMIDNREAVLELLLRHQHVVKLALHGHVHANTRTLVRGIECVVPPAHPPHRTAPHRTAPQRNAPHRNAPQRTATHRNEPHCAAQHRTGPPAQLTANPAPNRYRSATRLPPPSPPHVRSVGWSSPAT
jgi:hypothetical protein